MQITAEMHPRIAELAALLLPLVNQPVTKPTRFDHDKLQKLRCRIQDLSVEGGLELNEGAEHDRQYLYREATLLVCAYQEFYDYNCSRWEPMTKEGYVAMGADAPLDSEFLGIFLREGLNAHDVARDLITIRRALRVSTLGNLAARSRFEISVLCTDENNELLNWIDAVCKEFKIDPPKGEG